MKHCTRCGKELPTPLDEYGLVGEEICFDCHFNEPDYDPSILAVVRERQLAAIKEADDYHFAHAIHDTLNIVPTGADNPLHLTTQITGWRDYLIADLVAGLEE